MRKTISLLVLGSVSVGLICGCDTTPEVIYVPQPSHTGRDVGITLGVVGAGVAVTFLAVHGKHVVKGCTAVDQGFTLVGDTVSIHAGEVLRLKGHKGKKDKSGHRDFLVEEVAKDYGGCADARATP
jgi:hypothetical protein